MAIKVHGLVSSKGNIICYLKDLILKHSVINHFQITTTSIAKSRIQNLLAILKNFRKLIEKACDNLDDFLHNMQQKNKNWSRFTKVFVDFLKNL